MSTRNIIDQDFDEDTGILTITFQCRDGSQPSYSYAGLDAIAILGGADPADYEGEAVG